MAEGGSSPAVGFINANYDAKGMSLSRYREIGKDEIKITLKWDKVAKRIDELIQLDRYLNKKEKEYYPAFLQNQLQHQLEYERKSINQSITLNLPMIYRMKIFQKSINGTWETAYMLEQQNTKLLKVVMK